MARYFAVIVERDGFELFRKPLHVRKMSEVANGLAVAFRAFRNEVPEDALPTRELTIRFEDRFE